MKRITLCSPAKLNLSLKIVGKRSDGYHNLSTLFEKIDLCDEICLKQTSSGRIRIFCDYPGVPKGPKNLAYKIAKLLKDDLSVELGVDITIIKRIPVAAGLAGGSSNAATTLLGLNKIWKLNLTKDQMVKYAKRVGSDVPLFIYTYKWSKGTERGDKLKKLEIRKKIWHILVIPRIKVYSQQVFRASKMQLTKRSDNVNILTRALRNGNLKKVGQFLSNDLEAAIVHVHPQLLLIKKNIRNISGLDVSFSGSGPSIFGIVSSLKQAKQLQSVLSKAYKRVFVARTL